MKPRKNYRTRPKKSGAKKRQRISVQKKRLIAAGIDEETVRHMTSLAIRNKLKELCRKRAPKKKPAVKKVAKKKAVKKKSAAKRKPASKKK